MVTNLGRRKFTAASNRACSFIVGLDSPNWMTGMLDAEYLMMSGGRMPGGSWRSADCSWETICATAVGMLAPGWKNTLMTAMPFSDCDSMCSMSLTVVVRLRSFCAVIRLPISWADRPP
jgi:hypothetical protein